MNDDLKSLTFTALLNKIYTEGADNLQKLTQSADPQIAAAASALVQQGAVQELKPDQAEKLMAELGDSLTAKYMFKKEEAADLISQINEGAIASTFTEIISSMPEESKSHWDKFLSLSPNQLQVAFTIDQMAQKLLGKTFDEIYTKTVERLCYSIITTLEKSGKVVDSVNQLSESQKSEIEKLLTAGQGQQAYNLLFAQK